MTAYRAITTCNAEGWEKTGRRMAESFVNHWQGVELTVYAEGFVPDVEGVRVAQLPVWLGWFKAKHSDNPDARGMATGTYDFRRDCVRFAHKVAALTDADKLPGVTRGLVWLDADTLTFADVNVDWLDSLWPEAADIAWLDRPATYPECGFLLIKPASAVLEALEIIYRNRQVLDLAETHDSFAFKWIVDQLGADALNLCGPKSHRGHPWLGSRLAEKMDHLKGARKAFGRTPKHERMVRDGVEYWR